MNEGNERQEEGVIVTSAVFDRMRRHGYALKRKMRRKAYSKKKLMLIYGRRIVLLAIFFVMISVNPAFAQRDMMELNKILSYETTLAFVNPFFGRYMGQSNLNALSGKTYSVFIEIGCEDMYAKLKRAYNLKPANEFFCGSDEELSVNIAMAANQAGNALFIVKQSENLFGYSNSRWLVLLDDPRNILPRKK